MKTLALSLLFLPFLLASPAPAEANDFTGDWAFTLPDGNPAWLSIDEDEGALAGSLLWRVGVAKPVTELGFESDSLRFTRKLTWKPHGEEPGKRIEKPFAARLTGDGSLVLTVIQKTAGDAEAEEERYTLVGKRLPPLPPKPELEAVTFGEPIDLIAAGMEAWELDRPDRKRNGWAMAGGVLRNKTPKKDHGAYGSFGNLRTKRTFTDFRLTIEYRLPEGGNSGIYLRGMYEAQVVDAAGKPASDRGPGSIYGRLKPSENTAKPAGEWNRYEITLAGRHVTVALNSVTVIDNEPIAGPTGGGLSADVAAPGPLFLQGDHTSVEYRKIVLEPRL